MKNIFLMCCVIGWVHSGFSQNLDRAYLERSIDAYLAPLLAMDAYSGVISIARGGEIVFQKGYGLADREWNIPNAADIKFRLASISKVFTETAVLQLAESGKLSLEDSLSRFVPDYPRGDEIRVRHLLNHTSGIPHLNNFADYDTLIKFSHTLTDLIDLFRNRELEFEPGARYRYSNSGYVLLTLIIEKISGLAYADYLAGNLFGPLGLKDTGIDDEKKILPKRARGYMFGPGGLENADYVNMSIKIGGGSLYSTADDLHTFIRELLKGKVLTNTLRELPNFSEKFGKEVFFANGRVQGFCHQVTHWIPDDLTILVLGNNYTNIALPTSDDLYHILFSEPYDLPVNYESQKQSVPVAQLKKYEGTYDFHFGPVGIVEVQGEELTYRTQQGAVGDVLIPLGDHRFFYKQYWVILEFAEEAEQFQRLDWIMGDNAYPADRVK